MAVPAAPSPQTPAVTVQVPPGAGPGQTMQFQLADGRVERCVIPAGVAAGGTFLYQPAGMV